MHVLLAYDESSTARSAIEAGALLFPGARATVVHLWTPPFASEPLRRRLHERAATATELVDLLEREGESEAGRLVRAGAVLADAAGWVATPLVRRSFGGDGFKLAALAEELHPDVLVVGSRGLSGAAAMLGSTTDLLVHHATVPVLVVPHPILTDDLDRLAGAPVAVGWDGSDGAAGALRAVGSLFPGREVVSLAVGETAAGPPAGVTQRTIAAPAPVPGPARALARELLAGARQEGAAVLAVGSRGRSAVREILLGSTAMAALHHAHLPVLVVPRTERGATPR